MTAQEAAKESWSWIKHYRWAVGFVGIGAIGLVVGSSYEDLNKAGFTLSGAGSAIWGAILWIVERSAKRTTAEVGTKIETAVPAVASQVADRIWEQLGSVQQVVNQTSSAVMQLSAQVSQTEETRRVDHRENSGQLKAVKQDIEAMKQDHNEMREAIVHVGQAVEAVNKDFKMRPFKSDGK